MEVFHSDGSSPFLQTMFIIHSCYEVFSCILEECRVVVVRSRSSSCFEPEYSWINVFCGDFSTKAFFVWYIILILCKLLIYCGIFFIDLFIEVFVKGVMFKVVPSKENFLKISVLFLLSNTGMLLSPISGRTDFSSVFLVIFLKVFQKKHYLLCWTHWLTCHSRSPMLHFWSFQSYLLLWLVFACFEGYFSSCTVFGSNLDVSLLHSPHYSTSMVSVVFSFLFLWVVPVLLVLWWLCLRMIGIFHLLCDHLSVYSQSTLQICVPFCFSIRSSLLCWAAKLSLGSPMCHLIICWCLLVPWYGQTLLTHVLVYYSWSGVFGILNSLIPGL